MFYPAFFSIFQSSFVFNTGSEYRILLYEEADQQLKQSFAQIQMLTWGLILFVDLIGILNIINTVYTNIHTRVTEIGMQRAFIKFSFGKAHINCNLF